MPCHAPPIAIRGHPADVSQLGGTAPCQQVDQVRSVTNSGVATYSAEPVPVPGFRLGSGQVRNNDVMLAIRRLAGADMPGVTAIVRGLPDYFTSDVPGLIERDAAGHDVWVLLTA